MNVSHLLRLASLALPCLFSLVRADPPIVHSDGSVTIALSAPDAKSVQVDIKGRTSNANDNKPFDMKKSSSGDWSYTSEPLDPGFHYYLLHIDGFRFSDASNPLYFGWGRPTNGVEIPSADDDYYEAQDVPRGEVRIRPYYSKITETWREAYIYTPPGYDAKPRQRFPVLYLQHGSGENRTSWSVQGRAGIILDNLIASGKCVPMIIVMETGYAYAPDAAVDEQGRRDNSFEEMLVEETIPMVDSLYRTKADKANRAIAGLSMGAGQAYRIALSHLDLFSYLGCFSGGGRDSESYLSDPEKVNEALALFWIGCGTEDFVYDRVNALTELLGDKGVTHQFHSHPGTHEWQAWREHLNLFAPMLFQE